MKKHLNTLFVTTQGAYLRRDGETIAVIVEKTPRLRLPIHTIGSIVCFGRVSCSPAAMRLCGERSVAISFLSEHGRFMGRVEGRISGNVLLRREQYRRADNPDAAALIAITIVAAKIANNRTVLQRALRDHPDNPHTGEIRTAVQRIQLLLRELKQALPLQTLRGLEGDAARSYFHTFDHLITAQEGDFFLHSRNRRPPLDNMNALLSFIYTLLVLDVSAALQAVGLDPAVGYLHRDRPGRPGLALDLMEEFRAFLGDRLALSLVNLRQVQASGFRKTESGGVLMDGATRKKVIVAYQKRKQEEIRHPFLGEKVTVGLLPHIQALLLGRYLRGDLDAYPPFIWK